MLQRFRNITYPYANDDDTFVARGYHLNVLVDTINEYQIGVEVDPIDFTGSIDIVLGNSVDIDAAYIDYKGKFPDSSAISPNYDEAGKIIVNNSSEHVNKPQLIWTREAAFTEGTTPTNIDIEFLVISNQLTMRVTNNSGNTLHFTFTAKLMSYVS